MHHFQFGPKKVIDCRIDEKGKQSYKVKWEPTWESAESLRSYSHLVDEFWSFVHYAQETEYRIHSHKVTDSSVNDSMQVASHAACRTDSPPVLSMQQALISCESESLSLIMQNTAENYVSTASSLQQAPVAVPRVASLSVEQQTSPNLYRADMSTVNKTQQATSDLCTTGSLPMGSLQHASPPTFSDVDSFSLEEIHRVSPTCFESVSMADKNDQVASTVSCENGSLLVESVEYVSLSHCETGSLDVQKLSPNTKAEGEDTTSAPKDTSSAGGYLINPEAPVAVPTCPEPVSSLMSPPLTPMTPVKSPVHLKPPPHQGSSPLNSPLSPSPSRAAATPIKKEMSGERTIKPPLATYFTPTKLENSPHMGRQSKMKSPAGNLTNSDKPMSDPALLKFVQNFSHPYLKMMLLCKICNKEPSMKFAKNWKRHFLSHNNELPPKEKGEAVTPPEKKKKRLSENQNTPVKSEELLIKSETI